MIVGLSGKKQTGKNLSGEILQWLLTLPDVPFDYFRSLSKEDRNKKWELKSFAHKVKEIVSSLTGIRIEDLENENVKRALLPEEWNIGNKPMSVREMLQKVGTDAIRNIVHPNAWVNSMFLDYHLLFETYTPLLSNDKHIVALKNSNWIITDVRFPNEANSIKQRDGVIIRIERLQEYCENSLHESETALDNYDKFDYVIQNNESLQALISKLAKIFYVKDYYV